MKYVNYRKLQNTHIPTSIHLGRVNRVPAYWLGLRWGAFTCVGWQVTLCDPIWQVTSRSLRTSSRRGLYTALTFSFNVTQLINGTLYYNRISAIDTLID